MSAAASGMASLVDAMLDVFKMEAGMFAMEMQPVSVAEMVADTLREWGPEHTRQFEVVAELPKNFLGKVLRRKLRETAR